MDFYSVKEGQKVSKRDIVGTIGTSGVTTGPHLHFELKRDGKLVNPADFFFKKIYQLIKNRKKGIIGSPYLLFFSIFSIIISCIGRFSIFESSHEMISRYRNALLSKGSLTHFCKSTLDFFNSSFN